MKQYVHDAGRKAVTEACERRGISAAIIQPAIAKSLNLPILAFDSSFDPKHVTVIISGTDDTAIERSKHSLGDCHVIINRDPTADGLNRAASTATGEYLLFLKAGIQAKDQKSLTQLIANLRNEIGCVGGLIHEPNGRIISAGIINPSHDGVGPALAFEGVLPQPASYYFYAEVTRNVSAVGGDCLLTRRETFERLGGFDSHRYPKTSFDLDFCARLQSIGMRCLHVGGAAFITPHFLRCDSPLEIETLRKAYGDRPDPFHNPNLSDTTPFQLGNDPPRIQFESEPIKALVFAHNLAGAEGAPRYLSDIVVNLAKRKELLPRVICGQGGAGETVYHETKIPVTIYQQPWNLRIIDGLWTRDEYRDAVAFYRRQLKADRPELVIANTLLAFPMIEAAAREAIPSTWIIHESYSSDVLARVFSPFAKSRCEAAFAFATRIVPCSHDTASLFRHLDVRGNIRVHHNAIDPSEIDTYIQAHQKKKDGVCRIINVGTVCERKGQHTLVEAATILAKSRRDFLVQLVGARDGVPYLDFVKQMISRNQLDDVVACIPETDSKPYFHQADIFACTSHMETYSRSMLEAMAFGLPIVSTQCQGVGEQVVWNENALKFSTGDANALASHLNEMIDSHESRDRIAKKSRAQFDNHRDFQAMLDQFLFIFRYSRNAAMN